MAEEKTYDIFISYRTTHGDWVKTLAHNLKNQGYRLFLDQWELIAGQSFPAQIHKALKNSACALLIATPDAVDSGWVQQELDLMQVRSKSQDDFFFIPVVMGAFPDLPFIETIQAVDFADSKPDIYRKAFHQLLSGLKQQSPGAEAEFTGSLQIPESSDIVEQPLAKTEQSFVDQVFEKLPFGIPVIVLAQADINTRAYGKALCKQAVGQYGADNVLHIYPPNSSRADSHAYFGRLGKQCHFEQKITESWEWADAMRERLEQGQDIFLLVTGFENGDEISRAELAGEMRQLHETFSTFHTVMMGSEKLAALKYAHGSMSLLNIAEELTIPTVSHEDLQLIFQQLYPNIQLSPKQIQELIAFTGCQPRLLHFCLQQGADSTKTAKDKLLNSPLPSQLFTRFRDEQDALRLCGLLQNVSLGQFEPWPSDELLRRLYWNNLITRQGQNLVWRCDFIRETGLGLLGC